jgi:excisionase family DNA binding protein
MTEFLTVPEVAARLRVDESTVRRHIRSGALPAFKACGVLRVAADDLDSYLEGARVVPQGPVVVRQVAQAPRARLGVVGPGGARDRLRAGRERAA